MLKFVVAVATAAIFALPAPVKAASTGGSALSTDLSSQVSIRENRHGGVNVRIGDRHRRWESRRARHHRWESRRRHHGCRKVTVTKWRHGRKVRTTTRRCD